MYRMTLDCVSEMRASEKYNSLALKFDKIPMELYEMNDRVTCIWYNGHGHLNFNEKKLLKEFFAERNPQVTVYFAEYRHFCRMHNIMPGEYIGQSNTEWY